MCCAMTLKEDATYYFILFISFAKKQTNKQTDKHKERWQGHRNSCGQLQRARARIQMYNSYVSLAVIFPLIEAWITTSNSCLSGKKIKITKNIEKRWTKR